VSGVWPAALGGAAYLDVLTTCPYDDDESNDSRVRDLRGVAKRLAELTPRRARAARAALKAGRLEFTWQAEERARPAMTISLDNRFCRIGSEAVYPSAMPVHVDPGLVTAAIEHAVKIWRLVTRAEDKELSRRVIVVMEKKRVFEPEAMDAPKWAYKSVKKILKDIQKERRNLPSRELDAALSAMADNCNAFKAGVESLRLTKVKDWWAVSDQDRVPYREALEGFRYKMGAQFAAIGEFLGIPIPRELVPPDLPLSLFSHLIIRN
jgi:hypothetical protein